MKKEVVGGSAILDTDRFQVFDGFMEPAQIMESIRTIHDDLSRAFKSSTTDYAKQEWEAQV